ncbi:MAG: hypothetical protein CVU71_00845 [Deltaproteobacteria bacterium HGW-Deltaproteobacteria-6]|jgi:uncharacterized protein YoxC|nr:MAG: hypothetical protein CVU71_00845 [Deltaproteobacteria bacterium HGW-Deltaproteobacteria-6]
MYLEIGLIIFGIALLLLVLFCVPILLKLWRAASDVTITLQTLNERLPAILKNMEEISANINNSTTAINSEVQKYAATSERLRTVMSDLVGGIELISPLAMRSPVFRKVTDAIAMAKGVRVFLNVLTGRQKV